MEMPKSVLYQILPLLAPAGVRSEVQLVSVRAIAAAANKASFLMIFS